MNFGMHRRRETGISVAPLIDIVFLLLVFFMLAGAFFEIESIDVAMPGQSGAASDATPQEPVIVRLHADETLTLNGVVMEREALRRALDARVESGFDGTVVFVVPGQSPVQSFVYVIDDIRNSGLEDIAMAIQEGS